MNKEEYNIYRILNKIEDEVKNFKSEKIKLEAFTFVIDECGKRLWNEVRFNRKGE